jgi:hypothetical protein
MSKTMAEVKANPVAGDSFVNPVGAVGTVLPGKSPKGKNTASFTCVEPGCNNTHVREASDWHQCGKCLEHAKTRSKSKSTGQKKSPANEDQKATVEENVAVLAELKAKIDAMKAAPVADATAN